MYILLYWFPFCESCSGLCNPYEILMSSLFHIHIAPHTPAPRCGMLYGVILSYSKDSNNWQGHIYISSKIHICSHAPPTNRNNVYETISTMADNITTIRQ